MGIHHCSESGVHDQDDLQLFKAIAQRVSETLTSLMTLKDLRASNERFQMLAEYAPVGIYLTDPSGDCVLTNRVWREMSGLDSEEAAGRGWVKGLHPEDRDAVTKGWYQSIREQGSWRADYRFQNRSGRVTWVEGSAFPLEDGRGSLTGYIGTNVDITERKRTEETQLFLLQCGYEASGEGFFQSLARYLAQTLQMDFVCIDALEGDGLNARTVAVWCDGAFQDNVTYALKDTPCGEVVGKTVCCFPASVSQFFPRDQVLQDLKAESYAGVTLWSHAGKPIGLIAVIARKPLVDRKMVEATLKLVAFRAAGELERKEAEDAIREKMNELSRWHQVTLGREMRILELKREVNELLAEVGKPPRFSDDAVAERPEAHSR
jgi:PAS domain S-box-containing protein